MGFKDVRRRAIEALKSGDFEHEARNAIDEKNLFFTGEVSADYVIELLNRCRGTQHSSAPHHWDASIEIHVFKPVVMNSGNETRWYIKLYLIDVTAWFISVHRS